MTSPTLDRLRARMGNKSPQTPSNVTNLTTPTATVAPAGTRQRQNDTSTATPTATVAPAGGRKWSEREYRARGLPTPAERKADARIRVSGRVQPATYDAIVACATERGITFGDALDVLIASAT